jgi:hypothetical protein
MISAIGNLLLAAVATAALLALVAFGFRSGDRFGDAKVRVRAVRVPWPGSGPWQGGGAECSAVHAEIRIDNQNDSPAVVSTRDGAWCLHLLGMVDGRAEHRFLIPLGVTRGTARLTVVVQHNAAQSRVHRLRLRVPQLEPAAGTAPLLPVSPAERAGA